MLVVARSLMLCRVPQSVLRCTQRSMWNEQSFPKLKFSFTRSLAAAVTAPECKPSASLHRDAYDLTKQDEPAVIEVFSCEGIVGTALRMRRRVKLGIALQIAGTQVSNMIFCKDMMEYWHEYVQNSTALLAISVFAVWKYHGWLRDAFVARHVTRIAIVPSFNREGAETISQSPLSESKHAPMVLIETGPWQRQITLGSKQRSRSVINSVADEIDVPGSKIHLGRFIDLGVLHVDRRRGHVLDPNLFEELLRDDLLVDKEEVITDMAYAERAYVSPDKIMPFLADAGVADMPEDSESSFLSKMEASDWYRRMCEIPGGRILDFYGYFALAMGVGTLGIWMLQRL